MSTAHPSQAGRASRRRWWLLLPLLPVVALLFAGCQRWVEPPAAVSDPVSVFLVDYGRHASLALPADEGLVEWSWGDWNWFALDRTGLGTGFQALFASPRSTLSRRALSPVESADALAARLSASKVLPIEVERARAATLLETLEARWQTHAHEAVQDASGRVFVPDDARYGLFNNSVHEVSRWLEALGAQVTGSGLTANFRLRAVDAEAQPLTETPQPPSELSP